METIYHGESRGKLFPGGQVSYDHTVQSTEGHAESSDDEGILYGLSAFGEDDPVMFQRKGMICPQGPYQRTKEKQGIQVEDHKGGEETEAYKEPAYRNGNAIEGGLPCAFSCDRYIELSADPVSLKKKHDQ